MLIFGLLAAFLTQTVDLDEEVMVKFEIWDTAGQGKSALWHLSSDEVDLFFRTERYRSLAPMYYRGAAAAVVVYDVTNKVSKMDLSGGFSEPIHSVGFFHWSQILGQRITKKR